MKRLNTKYLSRASDLDTHLADFDIYSLNGIDEDGDFDDIVALTDALEEVSLKMQELDRLYNEINFLIKTLDK